MSTTTTEKARATLGLLGLGFAAVLVGKISAERPDAANRIGVLPLLVIAALFPAVTLVSAVALLPYQTDVLGALGGLQIGPSDVLLFVGVGGVALAGLSGERLELRVLDPMLPALIFYFGAIFVAWVNVPSGPGVFTMVQRTEIVVAAMVVGVYLARLGRIDLALNAFAIAAGILAIAAIVVTLVQGQEVEGYLGVQKNPAGQAIANGMLIVLFHRKTPFRVPLGLVLTLGLIAAQSRGAIIATVVAVAFATVLASSSGRVRAIAVVPVLLGVAYAAFSALPLEQQQRLLNVAPGGDFATETRENYADDAIAKIKSAPFLGTGVGLYEAGDRLDLTYTTDPHNVVLLEAAEGGVVLLSGFAAISVGSIVILVRRRRDHPLAVAAVAVQTSTILHGVVDVYWVRGTPVLGWLLVGAALYLASVARREDELPGRQALVR